MRRLTVALALIAVTLGPGPTHAIEEDAPAGSFSPTGSLSETRAWHSAILAPDGRVFVVGGEGGEGGGFASRLTVEAWDPETGSFGPAGSHEWSRGTPGRRPALPLPDGRILVLGGNVIGYPASAEIWDLETGSSSFAGTVEAAYPAGSRTLLPDGRVLVAGGYGDLGTGTDYGPVATAGIWDPVSGAYTPTDPLPEARAEHTATRLDDGRVLIIGGWGLEDQFASAEVWDPATESFSPAGSLAEGRGAHPAHTATLLPDGRVLVVGGSGQDPSLAGSEVWDPVSASFSPAGSLAQARGDHSATLLPDSRVLVIGGRDGQDEFFASAEIWEPIDG